MCRKDGGLGREGERARAFMLVSFVRHQSRRTETTLTQVAVSHPLRATLFFVFVVLADSHQAVRTGFSKEKSCQCWDYRTASGRSSRARWRTLFHSHYWCNLQRFVRGQGWRSLLRYNLRTLLQFRRQTQATIRLDYPHRQGDLLVQQVSNHVIELLVKSSYTTIQQ